MNKKYIESNYKQAFLELKTAHTEDEQWQARKTMAKLEALAAQLFGFDYSDSLKFKIK